MDAASNVAWSRLIRPRWKEVAVPTLRPIPEVAVTIFSAPDDGCCDTRNMQSDLAVNKCLHAVASSWTFLLRAHELFCHLWPVRIYDMVFSLSHKRHECQKKVLNTKCAFWLSLQLLSETFFNLRRTERDMAIKAYWSSCTVPLFLCALTLKTLN